MILGFEPNATFAYELPGQAEVPSGQRIVLICRFVSMRANMRATASLKAALSAKNDADYGTALLEALAVFVCEVRGLPAGLPSGVDGLTDVLSVRQIHELTVEMGTRQMLAENERKNSAPQQPGSQASSAVDAPPTNA